MCSKNKYYDGGKVLSLKDKNNKEPEILIVSGNRSSGKSVFFNRYLINKFIKNKSQFVLLYRYTYELLDVVKKFFSDIQTLFFNGYEMSEKNICGGKIKQLFLSCDDNEKEPCGFAVCLNCADQIKKYSHIFKDVQTILFDEFQSETGNYVVNEIQKFQSIHLSIARGNGKQSRFVKTILISNTVSLLNPYYTALNISDLLNNKNTKFLRGNGFVVQIDKNQSAIIEQQNSVFNNAFSNSEYMNYVNASSTLSNDCQFIEKIEGNSKYLFSIKYNNVTYGIYSFFNKNILYCSTSFQDGSKIYTSFLTDHDNSTILLNSSSKIILVMREYFNNGLFKFKNLNCKNAVIQTLKY